MATYGRFRKGARWHEERCARGGRARDVKIGVETALEAMPKVEGTNGQLYLAQPLAKVFSTAEDMAKKAGDSFVTVDTLLTAGESARGG